MCVVVAFAQGEHIVRSLKHVDFFLRSPPGHPTSKHAQPRQNWFMIADQSLLILERVKVVGFWVFWVEADGPTAGRRRRARHRNPLSRPYTRHRHRGAMEDTAPRPGTERAGQLPRDPVSPRVDHRTTLAMMSLRVLQS